MPRHDPMRDYYESQLKEAKRRSQPSNFWNAPTGRSRVRVLPGMDPAKEPFFLKVGLHYSLGPDGKSTVYCPKWTLDTSDECPVCDFVVKVKARSSRVTELEVAKKSAVRLRYYSVILLTTEAEPRPMIWSYGVKVWKSLLNLVVSDDYGGEIFDLKKGYDLTVTRTGQQIDTEYHLVPCREQTSVDPIPEDDDIDLADYVKTRVFTTDELNRVLDGTDPMDIVEEREASGEIVTPKRETREPVRGLHRGHEETRPERPREEYHGDEPFPRSSRRQPPREEEEESQEEVPARRRRGGVIEEEPERETVPAGRRASKEEESRADDEAGRAMERLRDQAGGKRTRRS